MQFLVNTVQNEETQCKNKEIKCKYLKALWLANKQ